MIRVALVDDQEMVRTGVRTILTAHPDITVVAEAGDGLSAVRLADPDAVDVLLLDIRMPGVDGVEAVRRIRARHDPIALRILMLTTFDQDENVLRALHAGADGFLSKGAGPAELTRAVLEVAAGQNALSPGALNAVVGHVSAGRTVPADPAMAALFAQLTPREREVVHAVVQGLGYQQIAELMVLSPYTVRTHANRAMTKVGARDRAQLVSWAVRAGMRP